jgi:acyl-CoA synthetase (AMP-forming)/AMP-acid ligase II
LTTIPAQFEQTLSAVPDKAAIFSGGESLSFRQLHVEAASAAQALSSLGILAGDRVGICMQKNLDQIVAMLGVLWANAIFVPVHPLFHADQVGHMVDDCDMKLLVTDSSRLAGLHDAAHGRILIGRGLAEEEFPSLVGLMKFGDVLRLDQSKSR